ncbi:MAG TPA: ABC transporter ATP-binding protein [Xanthobacteraceae bacterium]|jgi:multiple sugar transport system ATP-binding protein
MLERSKEGLRLLGLRKSFAARTALSGVSLDVSPGEVVAVTGPSGAGKTTTARIVAGLEERDAGEIWLQGRMLADAPPQARGVALMFESYALYPHMTARENLLFPLRSPAQRHRLRGRAAEEAADRLLELVEMSTLGDRYPAELSGGQKQRVALCRVLIQEPNAFLLDEPISHLDAKLRHKLRGEIRRLLVSKAVPSLWFTPDAMEALAVGGRVVVLIGGAVQQTGSPLEIHEAPANLAVAKLVGDPPMNIVRGRLRRRADDLLFEHSAFSTVLEGSLRRAVEGAADLSEIVVGFRPSSVILGSDAGGIAEIDAVEPFGKYLLVTARLGNDLVKIRTSDQREYRRSDRIRLSLRPDRMIAFHATTGKALRPMPGRHGASERPEVAASIEGEHHHDQ